MDQHLFSMDAFYNVIKDLYCKINAFIFNFIFLKESWKMYHAFHKNIIFLLNKLLIK